jgi:hypothetical protein
MSYDLIFLAKSADQTWDDAIEAAEEAEDTGSPPDPGVWRALLHRVQEILGDVEVFEGEDGYELTHEPTGIQVSLYGTEAGISVPYHHTGERAEAVLHLIYRISRVVEATTGLSGYDPQLDLPIDEAATQSGAGVAAFDNVAAMFTDLRRARKSG